jgi:NADH dehydrogenase
VIVVAGGTGTLGTRLVPRLVGQGLAVRVLTRDPARARYLAGQGVEVVGGDVRDSADVAQAVRGAGTVISAVHGFAGPGGVSPATVDRAGNANLIGAATRAGAAFILVSVVGAAPTHPIGLFRAKYAAEDMLRVGDIPWTIVRATAFMETWATIMGRMLQTSGKVLVFGRGDNPVNFVSARDVAALLARAVTDPGLRGQVLEIGGPDNLTLNRVAAILQETTGRRGAVRHIPRPALQAIARLTSAVKPALARQAGAALAMDTIDMTFDSTRTRQAFPGLPNTGMRSAVKELLARPHRRPNDSFARGLRLLVETGREASDEHERIAQRILCRARAAGPPPPAAASRGVAWS